MTDHPFPTEAMRSSERPCPLPRGLRLLGPPLAAVYKHVVARRNRYWERHAPARVDRPVISIGNLSAGGTGKTPVVSWMAAQLQSVGIRPAIAMRGYKSGPRAKGDEQLEHESRLPNVPVIADPNRQTAISAYLDRHGDIDVVLLDDGFQHRQLHRDLDVVLIDGLRSPFDDAVLPNGYLREPVAGLARAHVIALTRTDLMRPEALAALRSQVSQLVGEPPQLEFRSRWSQVDSSDSQTPRAVEWLSGRTFVAVCGIGHPHAFLAMAQRAGARLADTIVLEDHAAYRASLIVDLARRAAGLDGVLTTVKDWMKIEPLLRQHDIDLAVHRPRLEFDASRGGDQLVARLTRIVRGRSEPG